MLVPAFLAFSLSSPALAMKVTLPDALSWDLDHLVDGSAAIIACEGPRACDAARRATRRGMNGAIIVPVGRSEAGAEHVDALLEHTHRRCALVVTHRERAPGWTVHEQGDCTAAAMPAQEPLTRVASPPRTPTTRAPAPPPQRPNDWLVNSTSPDIEFLSSWTLLTEPGVQLSLGAWTHKPKSTVQAGMRAGVGALLDSPDDVHALWSWWEPALSCGPRPGTAGLYLEGSAGPTWIDWERRTPQGVQNNSMGGATVSLATGWRGRSGMVLGLETRVIPGGLRLGLVAGAHSL